jgi:hypothetical protein
MSGDATTDPDVLTLYWLPGCSSCLRMKEFVGTLGVSFDSVNCSLDRQAAQRPLRLGVPLPAAVLGGRAVSGTDLAGIAALVGVAYDEPLKLAPEELTRRFDAVIGAAIEMIDLLPPGGLDTRIEYDEPGRERTVRQLVAHLATIMRGFVAAEDTNTFTNGMEFIPPGREQTATADQLRTLAQTSRAALRDWWDQVGFDDPFDRVLESNTVRTWTLHEARIGARRLAYRPPRAPAAGRPAPTMGSGARRRPDRRRARRAAPAGGRLCLSPRR